MHIMWKTCACILCRMYLYYIGYMDFHMSDMLVICCVSLAEICCLSETGLSCAALPWASSEGARAGHCVPGWTVK